MKRVDIQSLLVFLVGLLFLGASSIGWAQEAPKATLVWAEATDASFLDPQNMPNQAGWVVVPNIFDTLVYRTRDGNLQPNLAVSWENVEPTKWQFKLREGVKFHNGEPFDATSVKVTIERLINPDNHLNALYLFNIITGAEVVNEHTVNILTKNPDPVLPSRFSSMGSQMLPAEYVQKVSLDEFGQEPIGTGPYKFDHWRHGIEIVLTANPTYWKGKPKFEEFVFKPIPEGISRVNALITGEIDVANLCPVDQVPRVETSEGCYVKSALSAQIIVFSVNAEMEPFDDVRVRRALNYAIDKELIVETLLGGFTQPLLGPIPLYDFGYNPNLLPYTYSPEEAKKLLREAGYPNGFKFEVAATSGNTIMDEQVTEACLAMWREIGLEPEVQYVEPGERSNIIRNHANPGLFMINPISMIGDADGSFWRVVQPSGILGYYRDKKMDALLSSARYDLDEYVRELEYQVAASIFYNDAAWVFLYHDPWVAGVRDWLDYTPRWDGLVYIDEIPTK